MTAADALDRLDGIDVNLAHAELIGALTYHLDQSGQVSRELFEEIAGRIADRHRRPLVRRADADLELRGLDG